MTTVFVYEHLTAQLQNRLKADLRQKAGVPPSGGSSFADCLLREGRAMLGAIVDDLSRIPGVRAFGATSDNQDRFHTNAAIADYSLIIAPEFDGILETRCRWVEEAGGCLLGPSSDAVRLTSDKLALFEHLRTHGVPSPQTWPLGSEPSQYPIVCKPRDGAGSQATFLVHSLPDREVCYKQLELEHVLRDGMLAQEYVRGIPASVSFLVGPRGTVSLQPSTQQLSSDNRFRYLGGSTPLSSELAERATKIARQAIDTVPGLRGYVGVDVVLGQTSGDDRLIEINPRLTTSYLGLRLLADFNLAERMLQLRRGEPIADLQWKSGQVQFTPDGATFTKYT